MTATLRGTVRDKVVSVRSKNAGPFTVTFDLFFPDAATFEEVCASKVLNTDTVGRLYNLEASQVRIFEFEPALAIKISVPRLLPGGAPGDSDVAGGQQFAPLLDIALAL